MDELENHVHLDPEHTWDDLAGLIYSGVREGRLGLHDVKKIITIAHQEVHETKKERIISKALGSFFTNCYKDKIKEDENPAIIIKIDGKQYLVSTDFEKIRIFGPTNYSCPDMSFIIMHKTKADAKISAWEQCEEYIEEDIK